MGQGGLRLSAAFQVSGYSTNVGFALGFGGVRRGVWGFRGLQTLGLGFGGGGGGCALKGEGGDQELCSGV